MDNLTSPYGLLHKVPQGPKSGQLVAVRVAVAVTKSSVAVVVAKLLLLVTCSLMIIIAAVVDKDLFARPELHK